MVYLYSPIFFHLLIYKACSEEIVCIKVCRIYSALFEIFKTLYKISDLYPMECLCADTVLEALILEPSLYSITRYINILFWERERRTREFSTRCTNAIYFRTSLIDILIRATKLCRPIMTHFGRRYPSKLKKAIGLQFIRILIGYLRSVASWFISSVNFKIETTWRIYWLFEKKKKKLLLNFKLCILRGLLSKSVLKKYKLMIKQ